MTLDASDQLADLDLGAKPDPLAPAPSAHLVPLKAIAASPKPVMTNAAVRASDEDLAGFYKSMAENDAKILRVSADRIKSSFVAMKKNVI